MEPESVEDGATAWAAVPVPMLSAPRRRADTAQFPKIVLKFYKLYLFPKKGGISSLLSSLPIDMGCAICLTAADLQKYQSMVNKL